MGKQSALAQGAVLIDSRMKFEKVASLLKSDRSGFKTHILGMSLKSCLNLGQVT